MLTEERIAELLKLYPQARHIKPDDIDIAMLGQIVRDMAIRGLIESRSYIPYQPGNLWPYWSKPADQERAVSEVLTWLGMEPGGTRNAILPGLAGTTGTGYPESVQGHTEGRPSSDLE